MGVVNGLAAATLGLVGLRVDASITEPIAVRAGCSVRGVVCGV